MANYISAELHEAVENNDNDQIKALLRQGADPNHQVYWSQGWTGRSKYPPLHIACEKGKLKTVKILVDGGADVDKGGRRYNITPLHCACYGGNKKVVMYLVKEAECKVDVKDNENNTPLHYASKLGHKEVVKYLVEELKCNVDVRNSERQTPLHWASEKGHIQVVKCLVEELKCDVGVRDNKGQSPLDIALEYLDDSEAKIDIIQYLISHGCGCDEDKIKLLEACQGDRLNAVKELIQQHKLDPHAGSIFLKHPEDVKTIPGSNVEFSVDFSPAPKIFNWIFLETPISSERTDYKGSTTKNLIISKCLSKHKGTYKCVVTDESGEKFPSESATLSIEGEQMKKEESKLLGEILKKTGVSLAAYGIDLEQLTEGESEHTYEEMQYVLKDNPTTHVLFANLKEELTTRLEEERLYKEAMANDQKVSLSYSKILALGPGQVGKSTFLYRLMGIMSGNIQTADPETQPQCSTGVTELREAYITYTSRTGALTFDSQWQVFDESSDLQCQLEGLMSLLVEQIKRDEGSLSVSRKEQSSASKSGSVSNISRGRSKSKKLKKSKEFLPKQTKPPFFKKSKTKCEPKSIQTPNVPTSQSASNSPQSASASQSLTNFSCLVPQLSKIEMVLEEFNDIKKNCKLSPNKTKFRMLFNIADIGGQPAFLEMIPSLTIGPALYLVFMKLLHGLTTQYPVAYKCKDGRGSKLCKNYTYTSEEVIFTALSSIACFGNSDNEVEQYVTHTDDQMQTNSLALLVGTFKDKMKDEKLLDDIDRNLQQKLEETDFFKDGLIQLKSFLRVDNFSAPETEIEQHRKLIENIFDKKFRKFEIPTRWLTLSICLKLLARMENRHEVSFADCVKLGSYLGMKEEMVKVALQFLHKYIGLVMYFPRNIHLRNVVICDPQVVFSSISELIFNVYDPRKMYITEAQHDHFVRTGCFSPQEIKINEDAQTARKVLPIATLVHLLAHLNIVAEVPSTLGAQEDSQTMIQDKDSVATEATGSFVKRKHYYFLPAVLQTAVLLPISRGANEEQLPEPLCIGFKTGYLPLGFACALSANLIAESNFELIPFKVGDQQITYKNKVRFRFQGKFDIIMISGPKYCEFRVTRCSEGTVEYWDSECCPRIKTIISEAANRVIESMQYGSLYKLSKSYELAFKCPRHSEAEIGHEPLANFVYDSSTNQPKEIVCVHSSCMRNTPLSPEMKMWFGEVIPTTPPKIIREFSVTDNRIKIQAEGTKPLKYQWFKDDEELSDGDEYQGSTTSEQLIIVGTDPQLKGNYKCQVNNKYGKVFSHLIAYDPFVRELKKKGFKDGEISKLIDNDIDTLEDLRQLREEEMNSLGFKVGEKQRVKRILSLTYDSLSGRSLQTERVGAAIQDPYIEALKDSTVVLTVDTHLQRVKELIWEARVQWSALAGALGVSHDTVEEICHDLHCRNDGDRLERVLVEWMSGGTATICDLMRALDNPTVDHGYLSSHLCALEESHDTVEEIRHDLHCRNDGDQLERVLVEWMSGGTATICDLMKALDNPTVDHGYLSSYLCALEGVPENKDGNRPLSPHGEESDMGKPTSMSLSSGAHETLEELMRKYSVSSEQLDCEIEEGDMTYLAGYFDNVELYLNILGLTATEQTDVRLLVPQGTQEAMTHCLLFWRGHDPSKGTLRALLEILLSFGKEEIASKVCSFYHPKDKLKHSIL